MAGVGFWVFIYPVDVIKSKMQVGKAGGIELAKEIWAQEGFKGYYRGLAPCLLRAFPAAAATFFVFEYSKNFLEKLSF